MIHEPGHPNTTLSDWQAFREDFSTHYFDEVIDRSELDLPDLMLPLARGGVIASDRWSRKVRRRRVGAWPGVRDAAKSVGRGRRRQPQKR
jgi:hypothetical protein